MNNNAFFNRILKERLVKIKQTLSEKEEEYAVDGDRFHNFRVAGRKENITPERALKGMAVKHEVSVSDLIDMVERCPDRITVKLIDEKIGDNINYLILLEGLLKLRIKD